MGLVGSFNRPGGNVTGTAVLTGELMPKRFQLAHELEPNAVLFGVLVDPAARSAQSNITDLQAAARTLGLQLLVVNGDGYHLSARSMVGWASIVGSLGEEAAWGMVLSF